MPRFNVENLLPGVCFYRPASFGAGNFEAGFALTTKEANALEAGGVRVRRNSREFSIKFFDNRISSGSRIDCSEYTAEVYSTAEWNRGLKKKARAILDAAGFTEEEGMVHGI